MWALAIAVLALAFGCAAPERPRTRHNVLLVVVDTLRADRLGIHGNARGLTPFVDGLAARGFVFANAYTPSSHTLPSVASLLTSRYPTQHGVTHFGAPLRRDELTLAEVLRDEGYATAGFSSNGLLGGRRNIGQGFDTFWSRYVGFRPGKELPPRAGEINTRAIEWLGRLHSGPNPRPFFLYLHYMEPHVPFDPPEAYLMRTRRGPRMPDVAAVDAALKFGAAAHTPELLDDVAAVYDAAVIEMDAGLAALFDHLVRHRLLERTIVVVTNDHGEALGDHDGFGHGRSLYQELVHAPLVVLLPGHTEGGEIDAVVSQVDVAPSLLELLGLPRPRPFEGRSFAELLAPGPWWTPSGAGARWRARGRTAFTEVYLDQARTKRLRAVVRGSRKLILGADGMAELYDLGIDPLELTPLASAPPAGLEEDMVALSARLGVPPTVAVVPRVDARTRERLRTLGYVGGTPTVPETGGADAEVR